ncbi:MAG: hypothetical protein PHX29_05910, partial [Dehalococcoidales bacterium]|nr:hypothetical protein [Dehalococcoidales bacterium]
MLQKKALAVITAVLIMTSSPLLASCSNNETITTSQNPVTSSTKPITSAPVEVEDSASVTIKKPNQENIVNLNDKISVVIPPNTLPEGTKVEINQIGQSMRHDFNGFKPLGIFEITSSSGSELGGEITLEFSYDQSSLSAELESADQLAVAFYDEEYKAWQEV